MVVATILEEAVEADTVIVVAGKSGLLTRSSLSFSLDTTTETAISYCTLFDGFVVVCVCACHCRYADRGGGGGGYRGGGG